MSEKTTPAVPPAPRMNATQRRARLREIGTGPTVTDKDWPRAYAELVALESAGRTDRWLGAIDWLKEMWANEEMPRDWVILQGLVNLGYANAPK
ncbi:hypothetical protein [Planomonospora sp. ID82291]|uniref:hypothetical protein n=1 Tax=Planomonospora sp. ID82291 TaxID=2738136 RepID=UPI0018C3F86E|nr:hypothetical protein [Planomonospora sp. ID82291]MBG0818911.1 hypothetical protein [Planomonospora sp. ID82291]